MSLPDTTPLLSFTGRLCSFKQLNDAISDYTGEYALLCVDQRLSFSVTHEQLLRMKQILDSTGAMMVYGDYHNPDGTIHRCINYQQGSLRDDFDFGPLVMVRSAALRKALDDSSPDMMYAGWYSARLALSRYGAIVHIPEPLYTATPAPDESQFDYVKPSNLEVQLEMEIAVTAHLMEIGAWLPRPETRPTYGTHFPVEASIIIPVKNRARTIDEAIESALLQSADFDFNVIVVDNHSTDGTTEIIQRRASTDPRLIHIIPESRTLGIGGCWNLAVSHPMCGRFALQLDSDDLYSTPLTLATIVQRFRNKPCAMVIGSYILSDMELNEIPPGLIAHREWSDPNGHNNALRVNGFGAPRAFATEILRQNPMPDVSYGEDYAVALTLSRNYPIERIYDPLYVCRRWEGNSDASLDAATAARYNFYKDTLRTWEIEARCAKNRIINS